VHKTESISLAMTGASGAQYGLRLLEQLLQQGFCVDLMFSQAAKVVIGMETTFQLPARSAEIKKFLCTRFSVQAHQLSIYGEKQWTAPIASGSGVNKAMIVCPCTTGTLAAAATGQSRSLIERAIDVTLKERKQLLLVVRETPFSEIHLENMLKLSRIGALIMPANPGFYHQPESVDDVVDFMVARILDQLEIPHTLVPSWGKTIVQDAG
jgi:4-hydroxy-3-polyprenylbenzoate decarboxylase